MGEVIKIIIQSYTHLSNWYVFLFDYYIGYYKPVYCIHLRSKKDISFELRSHKKGKVSDCHIVKEVLFDDQYNISSIKNIRIALDIGAHIGLFSILLADRFPNSKIYCFEPFNESFKLLKINIRKNNLNNIIPYNKAVGKNSKIKLYIDADNIGGNSIFKPNTGKRINYNTIESVKLRTILGHIKYIDLLKIDCEGCEYDVLLNTNILDLKKIKRIIFEQHLTKCLLKIYSAKSIIKHLSKFGFKVRLNKTIYYPSEGTFWIVDCKQS